MKLKHLNIKPKVFPVPSSSMASSKNSWPLENGLSQNTTDYVLVQNGLLDWMVSEKACYGSQHESAKVNKCNENGRHFSWRQKKRKISACSLQGRAHAYGAKRQTVKDHYYSPCSLQGTAHAYGAKRQTVKDHYYSACSLQGTAHAFGAKRQTVKDRLFW